MASVSNWELSHGIINHRILENDYIPNWKPRKVSAFRSFPPRCGDCSVDMNLQPSNNGCIRSSVMMSESIDMAVENDLDISEMEDTAKTGQVTREIVSAFRSFPPRCGDCSVGMNLQPRSESSNAAVVNDLDSSEMDHTMETIEVKREIPSFLKLDKIKNSTTGSIVGHNGVKSPKIDSGCGSSLGVIKLAISGGCFSDSSKVEIKIDSEPCEAISVTVPEASLCTVAGEMATIVSKSSSNGTEKVVTKSGSQGVGLLNDLTCDIFDKFLEGGGRNGVDVVDEVGQLKLVQDSSVEGKSICFLSSSSPEEPNVNGKLRVHTSVLPKDKCSWRRVSAFRNFPEHCGRINAPQSIKTEQPIFASGNDCMVDTESEAELLNYSSEEEDVEEMLICSESLNQVEAVDVKTEPNKRLTHNARSELLEETQTSDFRQTTRANEQDEFTNFKEFKSDMQRCNVKNPKTKLYVPGLVNVPKLVLTNGGRDTRGPLEKKNSISSVHESDEARLSCVTTNLVTEPYCLWKKRKMPLTNFEPGICQVKAINSNSQQESTSFSSQSNSKAYCSQPSVKKEVAHVSSGAYENLIFMHNEDSATYDKFSPGTTQNSVSDVVLSNKDSKGNMGKDDDKNSLGTNADAKSHMHDEIAGPCGSPKKVKVSFSKSDRRMSRTKMAKQYFSWGHKIRVVAKKSIPKVRITGPYMRQNVLFNGVDGKQNGLMLSNMSGYYNRAATVPKTFPVNRERQGFHVRMLPSDSKRFSHGDARKRVKETLRLFHAIFRKLLQEEEAKSEPEEWKKSRKDPVRIDLLTSSVMREEGKEINTGKILGEVPGIEVGDEFQYRTELAVVGIHHHYQNGIDYIKLTDKMAVATSIIASGAYDDDMENDDVLIYSGQGGNIIENGKEPEDQKLKRGNLALRNSISAKTPVRVVRGWKVKGADSKKAMIYIYDGLYTVKNYWTEIGSHDKLVFMFELRKNLGQPELAWKELKKLDKSNIRVGICISDISGGQEPVPICAVNTFNNEKPPPFNYISKMLYPDWYHPIPPKGCDCIGRCFDSKKCKCAAKNGGEIPYNRSGAIVEVKPLVYECGPSCGCPPSCYNRVSQCGIRFQLEIFKTASRGWGIRSLDSIPSGSFICEYAGELLEDMEAEQRIDNDEYLFDIGQNQCEWSAQEEECVDGVDYWENSYTIDAAEHGNVGRFINHSCSPNLYAQNVLYDHDDEQMPHVMFFAAENIPPLKELTYHYNYNVGQIHDSNGNVKVKKCLCGTMACRGRMY